MIEKYHIPIKVLSESNVSEHWTKKAQRKKKQKKVISLFIANSRVTPPCHVRLTRIAPRDLDEHDNLRSAFKSIIDAISDRLIPGLAAGRADGDKRITWEFAQRKGSPKTYALEIQLEKL